MRAPHRTFVIILALVASVPSVTFGITCGFGQDIGGGQCRGYLTSGSSWTVPADWSSANNTIDAIGGGGGMSGGGMGGISAGGMGGGGGAFARKANLALVPGSVVSYGVGLGAGGGGGGPYSSGGLGAGAGGTGTANGGDTWFQSRSTLLAKGASGSFGGSASGSIGDLKYSGGDGTGGSSWSMDPNFYYSGGGGGGGAASMYGSPYTCGVGPLSGLNGACTSRPTGKEYDATHGSGRGGGGGYSSSDSLCMMADGSSGGLYGGGGGGAASDPDCPAYVSSGGGGNGAPGIIVITYTPSTNPLINCSVVFDQNPLAGESTTMRWTSTGADTFYINGVGYVSASGSSQVYAPGDYSGSVSGQSGTARCAAVLSPRGGAPCTPAVDHGGSPALSCRSDGNLYNSCGNKTACQWGCSASTNACFTTCQSRALCNADNTKVVNSCSGAVIDDCVVQNRVCSAGVCVPPSITFLSFDTSAPAPRFTASGHLQARPTLLRSGDSSRLFWNARHATSCAVSGTNGDHWDTTFSGAAGVVTSSITSRTTYTLVCNALPGATPTTVRESVHVDIVPYFRER